MPDMFDDEDAFFKKVAKINQQIREERAAESEKVDKMTDEELAKYEKEEIDEINRLANENGQKTVFIGDPKNE